MLAAWIEASAGDLEPARRHIAAAAELAPDDARCLYYLAYVVSHHGDWEHALELTARSRERLEHPWDQAANALFAARAAISAGDGARAAAARDDVERRLQEIDDPWMHVRRDAMLGELARVEHRFGDAVRHIGRAAETSGRLGFAQTEAYQLSSLGRAQCQAGDYEQGAATLALAIEKAEATGDVRLAALARVHLGRILRALGRPEARTRRARCRGGVPPRGRRWRAGRARRLPAGGDGRRRRGAGAHPRRRPARPRCARRGARAGRAGAARGRDRVARDLLAAADRRMPAASHFIAERDRTDADAARRSPAGLP